MMWRLLTPRTLPEAELNSADVTDCRSEATGRGVDGTRSRSALRLWGLGALASEARSPTPPQPEPNDGPIVCIVPKNG